MMLAVAAAVLAAAVVLFAAATLSGRKGATNAPRI
jgi:hypothetical protein